jgi:mono/diheme cytochrome c family protein
MARPALLHAAVVGLMIAGDLSAADIDFTRDVQPILAANCLACHGFDAESREAGLRLDVAEAATVALESGATAIVPGNAAASELIARVESEDDDLVMPPPGSGHSLSAEQKQVLRDWIDAGAKFQRHWAFAAPTATPLPEVVGIAHPVDRWIAARLHDHGLDFSPESSPETLLRRVHLDLIGLPPSLAELDAFLDAWSTNPDAAYETAVDRLLASPHYGERLARWWLDMARYADSNGYSIDGPREIWAWRDWVIAAFNSDMPFDQFTIEQLAGDLLPDATLSQQLATGFHRNTAINQEGGIDKEQFRIDSVFDRVATTGVVWLGLSVGCAQCHDHKFDPISQRDYYQLFAFFNNQDEPNLSLAADALPFPNTAPPEEHDKEGKLKPATTSLVLRERKEPRTTTLFIQGDFTRPADEVTPNTPAVLPLLAVADTDTPPTRLDLARWLVAAENPLTARVLVNRIWQRLFGTGLVATENDFGLMGTPPSHPELLDFLALEFVERGWSLKELHRLIVTSRTYRQSSVETEAHQAVDPANRWLSRQRRLRLDAEIVRDTGLTASGLLVPAVGGPPVFPPIPAGATALNQVKRDWKTSTGDDRYRRGLYTFLYRATPPPALSVFDAPPGITACTQRMRSNTPLQALALLNDESSVEMAKALADLIETDGLEATFRRCSARYPHPEELAVLAPLTSLEAARVLLNLDETITRE